MNDAELIEAVMFRFGFRTDTEFANYLNVDQSTISSIRSGKLKMSAGLKLRLIDKRGYLAASSLVEAITPRAISERIRGFNQRNAQRIAEANVQYNEPIATEPCHTHQHDNEGIATVPCQTHQQDNENITTERCQTHQKIIEFIRETKKNDAKEVDLEIQTKIDMILHKLSRAAELTFRERIFIVEGLNHFDPDLWPLSVQNISGYCSSDERLLMELDRISVATFLEKFKRVFESKSDKQLAAALSVKSQTISVLRKNPEKLGSPTGLKILYALGEKNVVDDFNTKELKRLLEDNKTLYEHLKENQQPEKEQ